tara:strand:- start:810 stop:983 length:174 start_codon:yes stop_codon:yes gene_type:complete
MIFKKIKYKDSDSKFDYEEIPQEDLWEDGMLSRKEVERKILKGVLITGEFILIREIK